MEKFTKVLFILFISSLLITIIILSLQLIAEGLPGVPNESDAPAIISVPLPLQLRCNI